MESTLDKKQIGTLRILIVDDEPSIRKTVGIALDTAGHTTTAVSNVRDATDAVGRQVFDVALVDLRLGIDDGLELIPRLLAASPWMKIVVITAYASIDTAVEAIRRGAADYLPKPFTPAQLQLAIERVMGLRSLENRVAQLEDEANQSQPGIDFSTKSPAMRRAVDLARQVATSDAVILLRGPSGTGKTLLAKGIHNWSNRKNKPFGTVSCPALSQDLLESELFGHVKGAFTGAVRDNPGRIAACDGGTLFLDEIGDLPANVQAKLLRFLQDREYERVGDSVTRRCDVRVIAATNVDMEKAVAQGRLREDLYYRINVIEITMPALSERSEDIEELALRLASFFAQQNHKTIHGISPDALALLQHYPWPGNVRELRNVLERASIVCRGTQIEASDLPFGPSSMPTALEAGDRVSLAALEETHIRRVLASTHSLHEAAEILGIDQATLWRRRKQYGI